MSESEWEADLEWDGEETWGRLESLAGVKAKEVEWLWPGRIAAGCLTLLAGDEGVGKSTVMLELAARVSRGGKWPDGQGDEIAGGVLLVTAENNREYSVLPMLEGAGADLENIRIWSEVLIKGRSKVANMRVTSSRPVNLTTDLEVLARMIEETPDCRLVVIDPITSFLGRNSSELMNSLMALAERTRVAIVGVTHLKGGGQQALHRVVGGQTLTTAARAVWMIVKSEAGGQRSEVGGQRSEVNSQESGDRSQTSASSVQGRAEVRDEGRRFLLPIKNNLGQERSGLSFELVRDEGERGRRVEWSSAAVETTADAALQRLRPRPGPDPLECELAEEFLREALADGGRPVKDVEEEGREVHGIRLDTLRRARKNLKVMAYRPVVPGAWWIRLGEANAEGEKLSVVGCQLSAASEQRSEVNAERGLRQSSVQEIRNGEVDGQNAKTEAGDDKRHWQVGNLPHLMELPDLQCLGENAGNLQELPGEESRAWANAEGGIAADCGLRTSASSTSSPQASSVESRAESSRELCGVGSLIESRNGHGEIGEFMEGGVRTNVAGESPLKSWKKRKKLKRKH